MKRLVWPLGVAAVLAVPLLFPSAYDLGLADLMLVNALVVLGLNVIWGLAGQIALGQAGFVAIGAYAVAVLSVRLHVPFWADLAVGCVVAGALAAALGVATLGLRSFYLGLATLSFGEIVQQVLLNWQLLSPSANGIVGIPQASVLGVVLQSGAQQYFLLLAFVAVAVWAGSRLQQARLGLQCLAVRGNERAAAMIGIDTFRTKLLALVLSAVYGAVAGGLYAQLYQSVSPDVFNFNYMVTVLAMLLIGGAGSTGGAVVGAALVTLLPELLRFLGRSYLMVYGFGLVALIIYAPRGLWGSGAALIERRRMRRVQAGVGG